ncbi:MAG: TIGR00341 family protein [Verrucomicrobiota bacterium]
MAVAVIICNPAEAERITHWALLFALAEMEPELILIFEQAALEGIEACLQKWQEREVELPEIKRLQSDGTLTSDWALIQVDRCSPTLLLVDKNRTESPLPDGQADKIAREVFDGACCDTLALRIGPHLPSECDSILVPTAGGPHARSALKVANRLAHRWQGSLTALFIQSGMADQDGEEVGKRILQRNLKEADIDPGDEQHVQLQVVNSDQFNQVIAHLAEEGKHDLLIIGASNSSFLRRRLFGTVPNRLLAADDPLAVAVMRSGRSLTHRLRNRVEQFCRLRVPQLAREERIALFERLHTQSRWSFDFMVLILLSTGIAALGLIQNSTAVVIGAMLVAPLMTPLLGAGLALVQGNFPLMRTCFRSILFGFVAAVGVGAVAGLLAPITELTAELLNRGGPTLLDMGVAFLSGIAASYCIARPTLSSALAGVAIAAALVPPIATVGISVALGDGANAQGASLLFTTNVVAIILGAALNFYVAGIRPSKEKNSRLWVTRSLAGLILLLALLVVPLGSTVVSKLADRFFHQPRRVPVELKQEFEAIFESAGLDHSKLRFAPLQFEADQIRLRCFIEAGREPSSQTLKLLAEKSALMLAGDLAVDIELITDLVVRSGARSKSKTESNLKDKN